MSDTDSESDFMGGLGGIQSLGILNALRTGDPTLDMVLAMSLPLLIKLLMQMFSEIQTYLKNFGWKSNTKLHERIIVHESTRSSYGYVSSADGDDSQNTVLIKAIRLYLHKVVRLNLREAHLDLTCTEDKNASIGSQRHNYYYDDSNDDDDDEHDSKTVVGALSKYSIVKKPRQNQWLDIGTYGGKVEPAAVVNLMVEMTEENQGDKNSAHTRIIHQYRFTSESGEAIDLFIDKAYQWYLDELRKLEDNARYLYELKANSTPSRSEESESSSDSAACVFKRYRLSDEKTFHSLFFRQKKGLLKLMQHFQDKSGKYAIEGYPHKLGLLLHGPPGSGKTSLIKALAHYTGRSIVNVPLARITTNAELMSIFFDARKHVDGSYVPVKLGFKDVIFVMEDIDAASRIVKRRDGKLTNDHDGISNGDATAEGETDPPLPLPTPKPVWHMLLESNESDCRELVKWLMEKSPELKEEAMKPEIVRNIAQKVSSLPGLGVVEDLSLEALGQEALNQAQTIMNNRATVDSYLSKQARVMLNRLEPRTEVDQALVDELLGRTPISSLSMGPVLSPVKVASSPAMSGKDADEVGSTKKNSQSAAVSGSSFAERMPSEEDDRGDQKSTGVHGPSAWGKFSASINNKKDLLNLTGLLNVLDGVVDSPRRIVIMTTNHVEQLDPALIRPGRIDKKLLLGYMEVDDVLEMLEHYFQSPLTDEQQRRIRVAMNAGDDRKAGVKLNLTPAQIEQLTAEHDEIDEMIRALEERKQHMQSRSN